MDESQTSVKLLVTVAIFASKNLRRVTSTLDSDQGSGNLWTIYLDAKKIVLLVRAEAEDVEEGSPVDALNRALRVLEGTHRLAAPSVPGTLKSALRGTRPAHSS